MYVDVAAEEAVQNGVLKVSVSDQKQIWKQQICKNYWELLLVGW